LNFIKAVLGAQPATRAKLTEIDGDDAVRQRLFEAELAGPEAHAAVLGPYAGLTDLAAAHGVRPAAAGTCLAGKAHHRWVSEADGAARLAGITGTPTYIWAGQRLGRELTPDALVARLAR
jgi:hypothetical protein